MSHTHLGDLMPTDYYRVLWPDGDVYEARDGQMEFTLQDARQIAQHIGGTIERID